MFKENNLQRVGGSVACLLLHLQAINNGRRLAQDLLSLLVVLDLGGDQLSEVTEGLGGIEDLPIRY